MVGHGRNAGNLLPDALDKMGSGTGVARSGRAGGHGASALLLFWIEIWPHEFYFVAGLLIMAGLGLFLFTSALGRVWCGYTCPQTVWTDLFILVERWIEGDRNARVRLWKANGISQVADAVEQVVYLLLISIATGGAWVFYFADAPTLMVDLLTLTAHPIAYSTIAVLAATTFVFGGFMREQICIYMCPWPRIQAAMMDDDTLTVAYRGWRGEPRGKKHENTTGDCIDCMACVNVCPMGIDIRDGQQMECITCALCIDACDDVMDKIGQPRGLIDYLALSDEEAERSGTPPKPIWKHILRPRTMLYTAMWSLIGVALVYALFIRSDIEFTVDPVRNPTFITLSDGSVRNVYNLRLRKQKRLARVFSVSIDSETALGLSLQGTGSEAGRVTVPANETLSVRAYVTAPVGTPVARVDNTDIKLWVEDLFRLPRFKIHRF